MRRPAVLLPLLIGGCAAGSAAPSPSLLPRPLERRSDAVATQPTPVATPDPTLDAQIADLRTRLAAAASAFDDALPSARRRVAAADGAAPGSDSWLDAQVALGTLDAPRTDTAGVVSELTQAAIARGTGGHPEYPALTDAEQAAEAQRDAQGATIAELSARLRR